MLWFSYRLHNVHRRPYQPNGPAEAHLQVLEIKVNNTQTDIITVYIHIYKILQVFFFICKWSIFVAYQ